MQKKEKEIKMENLSQKIKNRKLLMKRVRIILIVKLQIKCKIIKVSMT